ncbi:MULTISPECIES: GGDEF domain-containing protein [Legionella]|uniref:diguanylate cyclase n=1 Tax=Legionella resiliens TaxID=2905958 RepID=A0ABS8X812_9GAMM|nr:MULTISPECIES: sensor domain-containing diguanylate cyclase [unclassified Legionella]MCE0724413.1 diguanylate cyclase [Legionella sp. 9fVS26]MCE3533565.1 diguanylate cyclase [Legionella sp. 8cVS16]QLZ69754.1 sensor domain-containing diguanylate cyclase [Legionella sp. PC1000]
MDFPGVTSTQIENKLIGESYKKFYVMIIADFFATIFFSILIWNQVTNQLLLIIWVLVMFVFNHILRGLFLIHYHRHKKKGTLIHLGFWKKYFIVNNLQSGVLWSLGGLLFLYIDDPLHRMAIFVYLIGLLAAPAAKLLTIYSAYAAFMIPIWIMLIFLSVSIAPSLSVALLFATILYVTIVIYATLEVNRFLLKSVYLEIYSSNLLSDLRRSEESFRNTIENAPIGMAIVSPEGICIHANRTLQEILGYTDEELRNKNMLEITYVDDVPMTQDAMKQLLSGKLRISHMEKRYVRKDGSIIWAMVSATLIRNEQGEPINFITQMKDVSDRVQNEEKMRELNEKTMETLNELKLLEHDESLLNKLNRSLQICITAEEAYPRINIIAQDLFSDLSGGLSIYNQGMKQMETVVQWGKEQLLPKTFFPMDCFSIREATTNVVDDPNKSVPCAHYLAPPQGGNMALPLMVQNELIGVIHLLASKSKKLTQHQQDMANSFGNIVKLAIANINLRVSLSELSLHDPLTNLYNRRYLNDILSRELIRIAREKKTLCVAMLDIDDFKRFNDTYSHLAGDEVLKSIGKLLKENFRESDVSFRFGGEEFVVVLLNATLNNAVSRMEELREEIKAISIYYKGNPLHNITISIGVAEAPKHGATIDEIVKAADHALYAAKRAGKDQVKVYNHNI